ncbi:MAG: BON domain-containing protein [Pseudobdellovibrio sp.]
MKTKMTLILLTCTLGVSVYAVDTAVGAQTQIAANDSSETVNDTAHVQGSTRYQNGVPTTPQNPAQQNQRYDGAATATEAQEARDKESAGDTKLSTRVKNELKSKISNFNPDQFTIYSQNGEVTIQGSVNSKTESDRIEKLAHRVRGVKHVQNELTIDSTTDSTSTDSAK